MSQRSPDDNTDSLGRQTIGNAIVLHTSEAVSSEAREIAMAVPVDPDNEIVLLDLRRDLSYAMWESIARAVPRKRRGIRLIVCGEEPGTTTLAGQFLSARLDRVVIAPHGQIVRGTAGALFIHSAQHSGWVRYRAGKPPSWEAKRFPVPVWDRAAVTPLQTSATGVAEPIPGGVWIRDTRAESAVRDHWNWLVASLPCQPERLTVVLGCPGTPPISLDDIARFWRDFDEESRARARFVTYGKVLAPTAEPLGQVLADLFKRQVVCFTGMPIGDPVQPKMFTVRENGNFGWQVFAEELAYRPRARANDPAPMPEVLNHRAPLASGDPIEPLVYWYAGDAVVEVVQAGLWMRPTAVPGHAETIRATRPTADNNTVIFDDTTPARAVRMRVLAEDLIARLDRTTMEHSRLVAASAVTATSSSGVADAGADAAFRDSPPEDRTRAVARAGVEAPTPVPTASPVPAVTMVPAPPSSTALRSAPADDTEAEPTTAMRIVRVAPLPADRDDSRGRAAAAVPAPAAEPPPATSIASSTPSPLSVETHQPAPNPDPVPAADLPPGPLAVPPVLDPEPTGSRRPPRLQPTPVAASSAIPSARGLQEERAWLRRTLSDDFDRVASSVSRMLSEQPALQTGDSRTPAEILSDCVAVRLYLSSQGSAIDADLRAARKGPHVPFARCVVAGLGPMPSHRGPASFTTSLSAAHWTLLHKHKLLTEWGFLNALTEPSPDLKGDVEILVWAMTARRTTGFEPQGDERADNRVLFLPGTSFKVLMTTEPSGAARGRVLLRELSRTEIAADGRVAGDRINLDELAVASLQRYVERWTGKDRPARVGTAAAGRFVLPPGIA
ncbi:hypothetical protein [Actinoplanes sp. NPDC089786]|uniref:hypothetical protein n=1 Tax=Actinoplanes sp. NPDC089786 TaxID=3155185 RepID=UPI003416695C